MYTYTVYTHICVYHIWFIFGSIIYMDVGFPTFHSAPCDDNNCTTDLDLPKVLADATAVGTWLAAICDFGVQKTLENGALTQHILLMVQNPKANHPVNVWNPVKSWDIYHINWWSPDFWTNQQYRWEILKRYSIHLFRNIRGSSGEILIKIWMIRPLSQALCEAFLVNRHFYIYNMVGWFIIIYYCINWRAVCLTLQ